MPDPSMPSLLNRRPAASISPVSYTHLDVYKRQALHPPAHEELAEVFDAFFDDPELWVAILTGAGTRAFCAGNDLIYTATGKPMYLSLIHI